MESQSAIKTQTLQDGPPPVASALRRMILASLGVVFVGVAGVGAFMPGIPTVGPLILASILFTKSSPALEKRLIRNRLFARYLPYIDGSTEMSRRAKLAAICTMWTSITISGIVFLCASNSWIMPAVLFAAGLVGTVFILRFGKQS